MVGHAEAEITLDLRVNVRGTVAVFSASENPLYLLQHVKGRFCTPSTTSIYRTDVHSGKGRDTEPYAVIHGKRIDLVEHANTPPSHYSASEFLYRQPSSPFLARHDTFLCNGREYVLRSASLGKEVGLLSRSDASAGLQAFAVFRRDSRYSDRFGCIRFAKYAIAEKPSDASNYTLLCDGQPTRLLDLALLADALYRLYEINGLTVSSVEEDLTGDQDQHEQRSIDTRQ